MATATVERLVGKAIRRREDPRFITGRGTFTDDVKLPGTHHAFFVRSSLAHARIVNVDTSRARAHSGAAHCSEGTSSTRLRASSPAWARDR